MLKIYFWSQLEPRKNTMLSKQSSLPVFVCSEGSEFYQINLKWVLVTGIHFKSIIHSENSETSEVPYSTNKITRRERFFGSVVFLRSSNWLIQLIYPSFSSWKSHNERCRRKYYLCWIEHNLQILGLFFWKKPK